MQLTHFSTALVALLPVAQAQYGYGSGSDTTSSTMSAPQPSSTIAGIHVVEVGNGGLTMTPNDITVPSGEVIEFHFYKGSHSVAQSSFDNPCAPLNTSAGFFSGPMPVSSGEGTTVFSVVSTGKPMWYYCATGKHCQSGMVGVINKPSDGSKTIQQYSAAAAKQAQNISPSSVQGGTSGSAATAPPSTASTSGTTSAANPAATGGAVAGTGSLNLGLLSAVVAGAGVVAGLML